MTYQQKLFAHGLCIRCKRAKGPERAGRLECAECAAKTREKSEERHRRLAEKGLCIDCGVRAALPGRTICEGCAYRRKLRAQKARRLS